jgi:cation diffusion facilitator family transporter
MKTNAQKKQNVALTSVVASFLLTALKIGAGILTGSIGIISEAAHSALDFGAASITWFAVRISDKPADKKHHYGHAKVESVAALIETGLLVVTSVWIISAAFGRLTKGTAEVEVTWYAIAILVISIIVDFTRSRALKKVAAETNSQALEADALHFSSDILSSAVVLAGLVFVATGMPWADAAAGIFVALLVLRAAFSLGKKTFDILVDAAPDGLADQITALAEKIDGVVTVEKIKVKPSGPMAFVEMAVSVNRTSSIEKVQSICNDIENRARELFPVADITINAKPVALNSETIAERVHVIGLNHNLHAHNISSNLVDEKKHITFDVEIDQNLTIREAHDAVTSLEKDLRDEFDGELDICIHLDPLRSEERSTRSLPASEEQRIREIVMKSAAAISGIVDVHDIRIRRTEKNKLFITLHCSFEDSVLLENVHSLTSRLEGSIYHALPSACRVVIHAEPLCAAD